MNVKLATTQTHITVIHSVDRKTRLPLISLIGTGVTFERSWHLLLKKTTKLGGEFANHITTIQVNTQLASYHTMKYLTLTSESQKQEWCSSAFYHNVQLGEAEKKKKREDIRTWGEKEPDSQITGKGFTLES